MITQKKFTKIVTFYSYKGGVGRSMALANIATLMAKWNKKVLIIDWDLEAPGLHNFFMNPSIEFNKNVEITNGIVDMLHSQKENKVLQWKDCVIKVSFDNSQLDLISAGKQDEDYQNKVQKLNWDSLFKNGIGDSLNALREEWVYNSEYDYIFIDSRTGITDIGDICTVILPDIVVLLFVSNYQNINGIYKLYERANKAHKNLPVNREKLIVLPIPSRDEAYNEYDSASIWKENYADKFATFFSNWLPVNVKPIQYFNKIFIPYVAKWSFGEHLPIIENKNELQIPTSISTAYARIATLLSNNLDWNKLIERGDTYEIEIEKNDLKEELRLAKEQIELESEQKKVAEKRRNIIVISVIGLFLTLAPFLYKYLKTEIKPPIVIESATQKFINNYNDTNFKRDDLKHNFKLFNQYSNLPDTSRANYTPLKEKLQGLIAKKLVDIIVGLNTTSTSKDTSEVINKYSNYFSDTVQIFNDGFNIKSTVAAQKIFMLNKNYGLQVKVNIDSQSINASNNELNCTYNILKQRFDKSYWVSILGNSFSLDSNLKILRFTAGTKFSIEKDTSLTSLVRKLNPNTQKSNVSQNEVYYKKKLIGEYIQVYNYLIIPTYYDEKLGMQINICNRDLTTPSEVWKYKDIIYKNVWVALNKSFVFKDLNGSKEYSVSFLGTEKIKGSSSNENLLSISIEVSNKSDSPSSWVYVGQKIKGKWDKRFFDVNDLPLPNAPVKSIALINKHSTKPVKISEPDNWDLGKIIGVIQAGTTVTVLDTLTLEGNNYWIKIRQ